MDAGKKVTKSYSINCNPFSRAMVSPLSAENPTPGGLISNRLASSLSDIPNSLTALSAVPAQAGQKQKRRGQEDILLWHLCQAKNCVFRSRVKSARYGGGNRDILD